MTHNRIHSYEEARARTLVAFIESIEKNASQKANGAASAAPF
jgi:hypothetical protein